MEIVWRSTIGDVQYQFLEAQKNITAELYCKQQAEIRVHLVKMTPTLVNRHDSILPYDNEKPHVARMALQKLTDLRYEILPHTPDSPDLLHNVYHFKETFKHVCK